MDYRYVATMPMDGSRSIVHLVADNRDARFRFISFERTNWVDNGGFPVKGRSDIIVIPLCESESITEDIVKEELSKLHRCSKEDIIISVSKGVRLRSGGIPNSGEYQSKRYLGRYSNGPDPNLPPRGWDPR